MRPYRNGRDIFGPKKVMAPSWVLGALHSEGSGGRGLTAWMLSVI